MSDIRTKLEPFAQLDPNLVVELDPTEKSVLRMQGRLKEPIDPAKLKSSPHSAARAVIEANAALFGNIDPKTQLVDGQAVVDAAGMTHVALEQKHGDAVVLGGSISLHFKADGTLHLMESSLALDIDAAKVAKIKASDAQQTALKHAGAEAVLLAGATPKLVVASAEMMQMARPDKKYYLCWEIPVDQLRRKDPASWMYLVDAVSGKPLFRYSTLIAGVGTGYYSTGVALHTEPAGSQFVAVDEETSLAWATHPKIRTLDYKTGNLAEDDNDKWGEPEVSEYHERIEVDVHRYLGYALEYFHHSFGRDSWDGMGSDIKAYVHFSDPNNAYWSGGNKCIYIGDGKEASPVSAYKPFCAFDVVFHEFTHAINYGFNIVQFYSGETGALNEALADIFACMASMSYPVEDLKPWVIMDKVVTTTHPRSLRDPARDDAGAVRYDATNDTTKFASVIKGFFPDHYSLRYLGAADSAGVHANCPIIGHAIYLMVNGGMNRVSGIHVTGIGLDPVAKMLWHVISTVHLTNTSNFADFRRAMVSACMTLFPDNLAYLVTVKTAFRAVGIGADLFMRDTLADTGKEPSAYVSSMSPDIINRKAPASAALLAMIADVHNGSLCENIEFGQTNHVYFRIFNGGSTPAAGVFRLYVAGGSMFVNPATWIPVGFYPFPAIPAGGFWHPSAANQCLTMSPTLIKNLKAKGATCFIGVVDSVEDPAPNRMFINNWMEFDNYIQMSNNYAWRNCHIEDMYANPLQPLLWSGQFVMEGLGPRPLPTEIEIDTTSLPERAIVQVLLPNTIAGYLRFADVRVAAPQRMPTSASQAPAPIPVEDQKLVPCPTSEFAVPTEAILFSRDLLDKIDISTKRAVKLIANRVTRLSGFELSGKDEVPITFVVSLPAGNGARDAYLSFRQTWNGISMGQMNYLFRVRPR